MGLAERQVMANWKEKSLPERKAQLVQTVGHDVEVVLDEASFVNQDGIKMLGNGFFDRFIGAIAEISKDPLGKEAIQAALKKVEIKYTATSNSIQMKAENGVFSVTAKFDGSGGTDFPGQSDYKKYFMSVL